MVTSSLSSSDQCKQDLLIFNQLERLEAEQPEEAQEGARQGRGLVRGGQQRGEVSTVQYSTVQYSTAMGRGEEPGVTDTRVPQLGQRYFRNDLTTMTSLLTRAVNV